MPTLLPEAEKAAQRRAGQAARNALTPAQRAAADAAICARLLAHTALGRAHTVFVYRARGAEADCAAFCRAARAHGVRLAYPRCTAPGQMDALAPQEDAVWVADFYGILAPAPAHSVLLAPGELDAVLVPLTAFDAACCRIGMGGGFYDRYLPRCPRALKYGVAFSVQQVLHAEQAATDIPLDAVFTEEKAFFRLSCEAQPQAL